MKRYYIRKGNLKSEKGKGTFNETKHKLSNVPFLWSFMNIHLILLAKLSNNMCKVLPTKKVKPSLGVHSFSWESWKRMSGGISPILQRLTNPACNGSPYNRNRALYFVPSL